MQKNLILYFRKVEHRPQIMSGILLIFMAIFVVRLFYIQVIKHEYYSNWAKQTQVSKLTIFPERGKIFASDGDSFMPLVLNEIVYTVAADPKEVTDSKKVENVLRRIAGGEVIDESFKKISDKKMRYLILAKQVTIKQAELIKKEDLDGVVLQKTTRRVYPEGQLASQILGYVNYDNEGQYGLEEYFNDRLTGRNGILQAVTDVRKIPLTIGKNSISRPVKNGDDIVLSIDMGIQLQAEQVLKEGLDRAKATKGSMMVMNPNNGQILAMANYPTYSPEKYAEVKDYTVFQNQTVSYPYENGSVVKTLTMGAGLDSGAVTVNSTFNDSSGCTQVDDRTICNVEEDPRTAVATMDDTLHYSLNTGVVHVLRQMGGGSINFKSRESLYGYFTERYRFGELTGIEQAGEAKGIIIAPTKQEGNNVRYANMVFGQGMDQTMIQTASAFSASINGGIYYKPTLIKGVVKDGELSKNDPKIIKKDVLSSKASTELREMIWRARKAGFFGPKDKEGYKVGGKTGTSQVIDKKTGKYSDQNSIGSYLGFGGANMPEYVIMVRVDDSRAGGYEGTTAAGPIFNDMSNWMLDYLKIKPLTN